MFLLPQSLKYHSVEIYRVSIKIKILGYFHYTVHCQRKATARVASLIHPWGKYLAAAGLDSDCCNMKAGNPGMAQNWGAIPPASNKNP